jgi:hypothetical protein
MRRALVPVLAAVDAAVPVWALLFGVLEDGYAVWRLVSGIAQA